MLVHAGERLDLELRVLARPSDSSMAGHDELVTIGDPADHGVLERFADEVDVLTFENEQVDLGVLRRLEDTGALVRPGSHVLAMSNKATQREALSGLLFPVPPFAVATDAAAIQTFGDQHGWPVVVKTAAGGYDGRGMWLVERDDLGDPAFPLDGRELVVEPHLDLTAELAVLVARRPGGEMATFPVVRTIQRDGMCREVVAPSGFSDAVEVMARQVAEGLADATDAVGVLAVELFVVDDDIVLVNELAPRVHNSGHLTIEACETSQFEQHLRAVADLPLGSTALRTRAAAMANVVGDELGIDPRDRLAEAMRGAAAAIHLYGKTPRPERKIGHVTATGTDPDACRKTATTVAATLTSPEESTG
jgi:5-(carboxyamino)imidazole ribonucleotide synthase